MHQPQLSAGRTIPDAAEKLHWQLFRIMSTMRRQEYDRTAGGTLTLTQCSLLHLLNDRGPLRMSDLATAEQVAPPTMSKAVRRLVELGMVRRTRDLSDHRTIWVTITPKGVAAQQDAVADMYEVITSSLSPVEIEALHTALAPLEQLADSVIAMPTPTDPEFDY